ncbi:MAG: RagB/SusD family nutrient uptake outer membrane protein [Cyclobacteriaceae bacterium]
MKRYRSIILGLLVVTAGCAELDLAPEDVPSDATFFSQTTDFKNYMNGLYTSLSTGSSAWVDLASSSDNFVNASNVNQNIYRWDESGISGTTSNDWNNSYNNIRDANYLLDNKGKVDRDAATNHFIGEAFYARAWYYFTLLQNFGGVPYIDRALGTEDPDLYKPRESRDFIAEKIIQDLDSAIALMQWQGVGSASDGRLNKESALVLKTRVGLFEGSWEYYHGQKGTPFAVSGSDGTEFLQAVIEAGDILIDGGITLFQGRAGHVYTDLFVQEDYTGVNGAYFWRGYDVDLGIVNNTTRRTLSMGGGSVTKSVVDNTLLSDGLPEGLSGVAYDYTDQTSLLSAKDPRLEEIIFSPARGSYEAFFLSEGLPTTEANRDNIYPIMTGNFGGALGGYATYKHGVISTVNLDANSTDALVLRAGEALLNYAEAKAILGTINQSDIDKTVNVIRDRVGMAHMNLADVNSWAISYAANQGYDPAGSNIVNEIRRERRIELLLEGFRNYDLRRWAILEDVINGYKPRGAYYQELADYWNDEATVLAAGFTQGEVSEVKLIIGVTVDTLGEYVNPLWRDADFADESARGYYINPERDYLQSIPSNEINFYSETAGVALEQNPGWF